MPTTINGADVQAVLDAAHRFPPQDRLTPSPEDWRDCWIYFVMVDRFNNPAAPPKAAFDSSLVDFRVERSRVSVSGSIT